MFYNNKYKPIAYVSNWYCNNYLQLNINIMAKNSNKLNGLYGPSKFVMVPYIILPHKDMNPTRAILYSYINRLSETIGCLDKDNEFVSNKLGIGKSTISKSLSYLFKKFWVRIENGNSKKREVSALKPFLEEDYIRSLMKYGLCVDSSLFIKIPYIVLTHKTMNPTMALIYGLALSFKDDENKDLTACNKTISKILGIGESTVSTNIQILEEAGWFRIINEKGKYRRITPLKPNFLQNIGHVQNEEVDVETTNEINSTCPKNVEPIQIKVEPSNIEQETYPNLTADPSKSDNNNINYKIRDKIIDKINNKNIEKLDISNNSYLSISSPTKDNLINNDTIKISKNSFENTDDIIDENTQIKYIEENSSIPSSDVSSPNDIVVSKDVNEPIQIGQVKIIDEVVEKLEDTIQVEIDEDEQEILLSNSPEKEKSIKNMKIARRQLDSNFKKISKDLFPYFYKMSDEDLDLLERCRREELKMSFYINHLTRFKKLSEYSITDLLEQDNISNDDLDMLISYIHGLDVINYEQFYAVLNKLGVNEIDEIYDIPDIDKFTAKDLESIYKNSLLAQKI